MTRLALIVALSALFGCGGPVAAIPAVVEAPTLTLVQLLPPNADYVVYLKPVDALGGTLGRGLAPLLPSSDRDVVARRLGGDIGSLEEAAYAEVEGRALYLARGSQASAMFAHLKERMLPVESSSEGRVSRAAGVIGLTRYELALIGDVLIGTQSLADLSAALDQLELAPALPFSGLEDTPIALVVPTPLALPANTGVGVLMARHRSLRILATPSGEQLALHATVTGEFPEGAEHNFRRWFESIASSALGSTLGLQESLPQLSVRVSETEMHLRTRVDAERLGRGLADLLSAEIAEIRGAQ